MNSDSLITFIVNQSNLVNSLQENIVNQEQRIITLERENIQFKKFINKFYNNYIDFSINQEIINTNNLDSLKDLQIVKSNESK